MARFKQASPRKTPHVHRPPPAIPYTKTRFEIVSAENNAKRALARKRGLAQRRAERRKDRTKTVRGSIPPERQSARLKNKKPESKGIGEERNASGPTNTISRHTPDVRQPPSNIFKVSQEQRGDLAYDRTGDGIRSGDNSTSKDQQNKLSDAGSSYSDNPDAGGAESDGGSPLSKTPELDEILRPTAIPQTMPARSTPQESPVQPSLGPGLSSSEHDIFPTVVTSGMHGMSNDQNRRPQTPSVASSHQETLRVPSTPKITSSGIDINESPMTRAYREIPGLAALNEHAAIHHMPAFDSPSKPTFTELAKQATAPLDHPLTQLAEVPMIEFTGFPPADAPAPPQLSCCQVVQQFPNSLYGRALIPFVQHGWTARDISAHCPSSVSTILKSNGLDAPPFFGLALDNCLGLMKQEGIYLGKMLGQKERRDGRDELKSTSISTYSTEDKQQERYPQLAGHMIDDANRWQAGVRPQSSYEYDRPWLRVDRGLCRYCGYSRCSSTCRAERRKHRGDHWQPSYG